MTESAGRYDGSSQPKHKDDGPFLDEKRAFVILLWPSAGVLCFVDHLGSKPPVVIWI